MSKRRDSEKVFREIKYKTRSKFSAAEKIRIVLEGLSSNASGRVDHERVGGVGGPFLE